MANEEKPKTGLTGEGELKVKAWLRAMEEVRQRERNLDRAKTDEDNAHDELANWLIPPDMKMDEKICIWFGDSLIQVAMHGTPMHKVGGGKEESSTHWEPKVTIRTAGKSVQEIR